MSVTDAEARATMKACQIGHSRWGDLNNLLADCYGTIGALLADRERLTKATAMSDRKEFEVDPRPRIDLGDGTPPIPIEPWPMLEQLPVGTKIRCTSPDGKRRSYGTVTGCVEKEPGKFWVEFKPEEVP